MEQLAIAIPNSIENLSLPSPELLQFYKDVENRIIWIEGEIDESLFESSKLIMIKSYHIPVNYRICLKIIIKKYAPINTVLYFRL